MTSFSAITALVVGATGATGRHAVKMLLDQGHNVRVVVRSKQKMFDLIGVSGSDEVSKSFKGSLSVTEASFLDLSDDDIQAQVDGCDAVISCLGHTLDRSGLLGRKSRRLVTKATEQVRRDPYTVEEMQFNPFGEHPGLKIRCVPLSIWGKKPHSDEVMADISTMVTTLRDNNGKCLTFQGPKALAEKKPGTLHWLNRSRTFLP